MPFRETVVKKRAKTVNALMTCHDYSVILISLGNYFKEKSCKINWIFFKKQQDIKLMA